MDKKIIAVNAGPRRGWNTDSLIKEASRAAENNGNTVIRYDLYDLEGFNGCRSCFGCKKEANKGHCIIDDGLTPVLDDIRNSDGLIIGSPNYLGELSSAFRALYERLIFQNLTYNLENPSCNERQLPVLLLLTCNAKEETYQALMERYQQTFNRFIGPCEYLISGDTLQLNDYSKTDWKWSMFDPEAKKIRHETIFPEEKERVYQLALKLFD